MFTKTLVAALVAAATLTTLAVKADARPTQPAPSHDSYYMDRASQNHDNGGN